MAGDSAPPVALLPAGHAALAQTGRVTDSAEMFDPAQRNALDNALAAVEAHTGRQVVIVTLVTLGGQHIDDYARDLGNRWGIGHSDRKDGVVILLVLGEQLVRIAVGQGLEDLLSDELCQQIIDDRMLPDFREGRFAEGLTNGLAALSEHL